jgi:hypothetical protein
MTFALQTLRELKMSSEGPFTLYRAAENIEYLVDKEGAS